MVVASALIIWKTLCLFSHSESPIVVVLSESMSPGFERGASICPKRRDASTGSATSAANGNFADVPLSPGRHCICLDPRAFLPCAQTYRCSHLLFCCSL